MTESLNWNTHINSDSVHIISSDFVSVHLSTACLVELAIVCVVYPDAAVLNRASNMPLLCFSVTATGTAACNPVSGAGF